jgi:hypothetical protein
MLLDVWSCFWTYTGCYTSQAGTPFHYSICKLCELAASENTCCDKSNCNIAAESVGRRETRVMITYDMLHKETKSEIYPPEENRAILKNK